MTNDIDRTLRDSYGDVAASWAAGPSRVYRLLADALVTHIAGDLAGARVLDLGAGTGVASDALVAAGSQVIAADAAYGMLRHDARARPPAVCADAAQLPFRDAAFDHVAAAFVLNHVPDLVAALTEATRVLRAGGAVVASTFSNARRHPAKDAIGAVVDAAGYVAPDWFETFKTEREVVSGSDDSFGRAAIEAGFAEVEVRDVEVDIAAVGAEGLAAYRLGMAHVVPFLDSLTGDRRAAVQRDAIAAAAPYVSDPMPMLVLVARVKG